MTNNGKNQVYVGRKAICQALGISDWRTVVRYKKERNLPVLQEPGYPPSLHREDLKRWHDERRNK